MLWLLYATILLLPAYFVQHSFFGLPTSVLEVLVYASALGTLIALPFAAIAERLKPTLHRYGWPIILFIISGLISTIIAPDKRVALGLLKAYIFDPLILAGVLVCWLDSASKLARTVEGLIVGGIVVAISGIIGPRNVEGRALGLYSYQASASPNFLALYMSPLAGLVTGLLPKAFSRFPKLWLTFGLLLIIGAIFLTGSRGATLAVILIIALRLIWQLPSAKRKQLAIIFLVALVGLGGWLSRPNFSPTADRRATTSNNLRYEIWRTTIVDILPKKGLTGVGLGNYQNYFTNITQQRTNFPEFIAPWARTPHNILLTIWTNLGLLGLVSFIWLLMLFFQDTMTKPNQLSLGLTLAMVALLVHGQVDAAYWKNDLAALFWVLLAFGHLNRRLTNKEADDGRP